MTNNNTPNSLYSASTATSSNSLFIDIFKNRDPTTSDTNYKIQQKWLNTDTGSYWVLRNFFNSENVLYSNWIPISSGSGELSSITTQDLEIVGPTTSGTINLSGASGELITTGNSATHTVTINYTNPTTMPGDLTVNSSITASALGSSTGNLDITTGGANGNINLTTDGSGEVVTQQITINDLPVFGTDGTNKTYVDSLFLGGFYKDPVNCASTANYLVVYNNGAAGVGATLTNADVLAAFSADGIAPTVGQRVLIKDQSTQFQNGIYDVTVEGNGAVAWVLTRSTDYDTPVEIQPGDIVPVDFGTTQGSTIWMETRTVLTIGTDAITFLQIGNTGVTTVNDNVLVGGPNNSIVNIPPSATAGMAFTSTGGASDPTFANPVVVAGGGTGVSSFPDSQPVCGGTTPTGNVQMVSSGTIGYPLLSNGGGSVPQYGILQVVGGGTAVGGFGDVHSVLLTGASATGALQSLPSGSSGQLLSSTGAGSIPTWITPSSAGLNSVNAQIFTSSSVYTPTAGMQFCVVAIAAAGGGGGGGGTNANPCGGGGGGAGDFAQVLFTSAEIGGSQSITIGGGGAGGNNGNGSNGNSSSFGSYISVSGGNGGQAHSGTAAGGAGGNSISISTGKTLCVYYGQGGSFGIGFVTGGIVNTSGGCGGCTPFGGGAQSQSVSTTSSNQYTTNGISAQSGGGGGSGCASNSNNSSSGGNGGQGYCTILEFIS